MKTPSRGVVLMVLGGGLFLLSLSSVAWRQSRAREALASLDRVQREQSLVEAEWADLERRIEILESRRHITTAAQERLGMHNPAADEIVLLSRENKDLEAR
jgi:cell division protein FtsL